MPILFQLAALKMKLDTTNELIRNTVMQREASEIVMSKEMAEELMVKHPQYLDILEFCWMAAVRRDVFIKEKAPQDEVLSK